MCDLLNKFIQLPCGALNLLSRMAFLQAYNDNCNHAYSPDSAFSERERKKQIDQSVILYLQAFTYRKI